MVRVTGLERELQTCLQLGKVLRLFFSSSLFSLPEKLLAGPAPLPNENRPRRFRGRGGFGAPEDSIIELYNYVYISEIIPSISSLWQRL